MTKSPENVNPTPIPCAAAEPLPLDRARVDFPKPGQAMAVYAEHLAANGVEVFPCSDGLHYNKRLGMNKAGQPEVEIVLAKRPVCSWTSWKSSNIDKVKRFWKKSGYAVVAIPCGRKNGIFVVDVDRKDGIDGYAIFTQFLEYHGITLPETLIAQTATGGYHYFFRYVEGLTNFVDWIRKVDIRTEGGFVIGAGSVLPCYLDNGKKDGIYFWINSNPIADCPPELLELLKTKLYHDGDTEPFPRVRPAPLPAPQRKKAQPIQEQRTGTFIGDLSDVEEWKDKAEYRRDRYIETALERECEAVRNAKHGSRNPTLFQAAEHTFEFVVAGSLSEQRWHEALWTAALSMDRWNVEHTKIDFDEAEIRNCLASGKKSALKKGGRSLPNFDEGSSITNAKSAGPMQTTQYQAPLDVQADDEEWESGYLPKRKTPIHALPESLQACVPVVARFKSSTPDVVFASLLALAAGTLGDSHFTSLFGDGGWPCRANIWLCVVAKSAVGKGPVINFVLKPLFDLRTKYRESYKRKMDEYWKKVDEAEAKYKAGQMLPSELGRIKKDVPKEEIALCGLTTAEKLCELVRDNPHGFILLNEELSQFCAQRKSRTESDIMSGVLCTLADSGKYDEQKLGRGHIQFNENNCVSFFSQVQPEVLKDCFTIQDVKQGIVSRISFVFADAADKKNDITVEERKAGMPIHVRQTIERLGERLLKIREVSNGIFPCSPTDRGWRLINDWVNGIGKAAQFEYVREDTFVEKQKSVFGRLVIVLHCLETACGDGEITTSSVPSTIADQTIERAIEISRYFLRTALDVCKLFGISTKTAPKQMDPLQRLILRGVQLHKEEIAAAGCIVLNPFIDAIKRESGTASFTQTAFGRALTSLGFPKAQNNKKNGVQQKIRLVSKELLAKLLAMAAEQGEGD